MHSFVTEHLKHHHLSRRGEITAALTLKSFGLSFISIFIPIYLYNLGYSLQSILLFFAIDYGTRAILMPFMGVYVSRFGPKHGLILSAVLNVVLIVMLASLDAMRWPLYILAVISGLTAGLHFLSSHIDLALVEGRKNVGRKVGQLTQTVLVATAIGPLLGGYIGSIYGLSVSLVIACAIVMASILPLLANKEPHSKIRVRFKDFPVRAILPDIVAIAGRGIDNRSANILWPLAIFLILGSIAEVGAFTSLTFLVVILTARAATRFADIYPRQLIKYGSAGSALLHFGRIAVGGPASVLLINIAEGMAHWIGMIPFQAELIKRARKTDTVIYFTLLEIGNNLVSTLFWMVLIFLSFYLSLEQTLAAGFFLASLGVLLTSFIFKGGKLSSR